jgi:hypothetical protein
MSDITQKPQKENPLDMIKSKDYRSALLIQVEKFTSNEVSERCRGMDEKLLERTALMCERISKTGENPSSAVLIIANLSKHKNGEEETLNRIVEELEKSPDQWLLKNTEKLSQTTSPEQLLKSLPLIERLNNWNRRAFTPSVRINEDNVVKVTAGLANAVGDGLTQCVELGKSCVERGINPEHLFEIFVVLMNKNEHPPSKGQFDTIVNELSKILPNLETKYDEVEAPDFSMDVPSDKKLFVYDKPEWAFKAFSDKLKQLLLETNYKVAPKDTIDEFIKYLKDFERKSDPFQKALSPKNGSEPYRNFKIEIGSNLSWHAGAVAFAKKMSEDEEFCRLIESSLSERRSKGYYDLFSHAELLLDPIKMLNDFRASENKPPIPSYPPDITEKSGGFPELANVTMLRYKDLKKVAESRQEVIWESSALETIWKDYRQMFEGRIKTLTQTQDIPAKELSNAIMSFLELIKEKHLFEDPLVYLDIGTASGEFSRKHVKYIEKNFDNPQILLTNPTELEMIDDLKKYRATYDATQGRVGEMLPLRGRIRIVHIAVTKDVMKFFDTDTKGTIWSNVTSDLAEGGVSFAGSTIFIPNESAYKEHVMHNGELVKVDWPKFIEEARKVKDYQDYLDKLDEIITRSRYVEEE